LKFTVILTTFNSQPTVTSALNSVLNLSPAPDEVVIIDDASQDDTVMKIKSVTLGLSHVKLIINPENRGQSYSRNLGVRESSNEYVIVMDDDDFSYTNRAKIHLKALENGADISYVSSLKLYPNGYKVVVCNSNLTSSSNLKSKIIKHLTIGAPLGSYMRVFSPSCTLAFRKSSFLRINGFNEDLRRVEDIEFACRALSNDLVLNWTSEIGLERQCTIGEDKSAQANFAGEIALLQSVRSYLSFKDYHLAKQMALLRMHYFQKDYFSILKNFYTFPIIVIFAPKKVIAVFNRLKHDASQRA
jgi:glycosyltransferase involved in cell wall biosynthesis